MVSWWTELLEAKYGWKDRNWLTDSSHLLQNSSLKPRPTRVLKLRDSRSFKEVVITDQKETIRGSETNGKGIRGEHGRCNNQLTREVGV